MGDELSGNALRPGQARAVMRPPRVFVRTEPIALHVEERCRPTYHIASLLGGCVGG